MARLLPVIVLALVGTTASAQTVYRCGADGRSYSQQPCADGRPVDAADPRTPEQQAEARRAAARDKALAANLERDRRADDAARRPATVPGSFKAPTAAPSAPAPAPVVRHFKRQRHRAAAR